jgi:succinate-semialdehyde dehydrogenase/glutarate-semialdehyde dehydrogenase
MTTAVRDFSFSAVALANDSSFGLGRSVFTKDIAHGKRVASRVDTGMVFINHPTWTAADLPFGGIKHYGCGRELSSLGIQEFVNKKLIQTADIDAPAYPPDPSRHERMDVLHFAAPDRGP